MYQLLYYYGHCQTAVKRNILEIMLFSNPDKMKVIYSEFKNFELVLSLFMFHILGSKYHSLT